MPSFPLEADFQTVNLPAPHQYGYDLFRDNPHFPSSSSSSSTPMTESDVYLNKTQPRKHPQHKDRFNRQLHMHHSNHGRNIPNEVKIKTPLFHFYNPTHPYTNNPHSSCYHPQISGTHLVALASLAEPVGPVKIQLATHTSQGKINNATNHCW